MPAPSGAGAERRRGRRPERKSAIRSTLPATRRLGQPNLPRWPAGFLNGTEYVTDKHTGDPTNDHDPFDHRKLHAEAFAMYPLVYSSGPDRFSDIRSDNSFCEEESSLSSPLQYSALNASWYNNPLNNSAGVIGEPYTRIPFS